MLGILDPMEAHALLVPNTVSHVQAPPIATSARAYTKIITGCAMIVHIAHASRVLVTMDVGGVIVVAVVVVVLATPVAVRAITMHGFTKVLVINRVSGLRCVRYVSVVQYGYGLSTEGNTPLPLVTHMPTTPLSTSLHTTGLTPNHTLYSDNKPHL